ncbi:hypothetical protein [Hydrogenophaga sp.]|uniref:hypothetical protein n=1 Tax=Hydrogenophaga sp. TaxID=1904254 RepID=UPI00356B1DFE
MPADRETRVGVYFAKRLESFASFSIFFTKSPIAVCLWVLIAVSIGYSAVSARKAKRLAA